MSDLPKITQLISETGIGAQAFNQEKTFSDPWGGQILAGFSALVVAKHQSYYLLNEPLVINGQCSLQAAGKDLMGISSLSFLTALGKALLLSLTILQHQSLT